MEIINVNVDSIRHWLCDTAFLLHRVQMNCFPQKEELHTNGTNPWFSPGSSTQGSRAKELCVIFGWDFADV